MNWTEMACHVGKKFCPRMFIESMSVKARIVWVMGAAVPHAIASFVSEMF